MGTATTTNARDRVVLAVAHFISSLFLALGILAALRTGLDETEQLSIFTVSPGTAVAWVVIGVVGGGLVTPGRRARAYLLGTGPLLIVWALLGMVADGAGSEMLVRDTSLIALNLTAGVLATAVALIPDRAAMPRTTPSADAPGRTP